MAWPERRRQCPRLRRHEPFHGSGHCSIRTIIFKSANYFSDRYPIVLQRTEITRNSSGVLSAGPIIKNKLFPLLFADYERTTQRGLAGSTNPNGADTTIAQGDFRNLPGKPRHYDPRKTGDAHRSGANSMSPANGVLNVICPERFILQRRRCSLSTAVALEGFFFRR